MSYAKRERKRARNYKLEKRLSNAELETLQYEHALRPRRVTQLKASRLPLGYQGRRVTKREYQQYLRSPHWRQFRERYCAEGRAQCCFVCDAPEFELHHLTYDRLWAEQLQDVLPLCGLCHRRVHNVVRRAKLTLARAPHYLKQRTLKERESYD